MQRTFRLTRLVGSLLAATFLSAAVAQDANDFDFDVDEFQPIGDVDLVYEDYDEPDLGAIVLSHTTPSDQHANFDVVGPDDYYNHFDFTDDPGGEVALEDLLPGVYSIAATDEGLELSHTVVEVRPGEVVDVHVNLEVWDEAYAAGTFDPYAYYGRYDPDVYPGYPYGAYAVSPYDPYTADGVGIIDLDSESDETDFVVTGPNGYSQEFEGDFVAEALWPGVYAVAATEEDMDVSVTTVEVRAEQRLALQPTVITLDESELQQEFAEDTAQEDVAGGGAGEDSDDEGDDDAPDDDDSLDGATNDQDAGQDNAGNQY